MTMTDDAARDTWAMDREIVLSRVLDAPRDLVFKTWSDPNLIVQWFGPGDWGTETHEIDIRVGCCWRFDMIAPDGTRYTNRMQFLKIEAPRLLEFDHGSDKDADPGRFRVIITFDEQSDGKTVATLRQLHPTKAQRDVTIGFGAVAIGYTTLDKLEAFLAEKAG